MGADRATVLRLVLVLEELFTNTVAHGYGAEAEGPVWISLVGAAGGDLEVTYEDAGPPFDPLAAGAGRAAVPSPLERGAPGGLGLALVRGLAGSVHYARVGGRNRITLTMPREDSPAGRA